MFHSELIVCRTDRIGVRKFQLLASHFRLQLVTVTKNRQNFATQ